MPKNESAIPGIHHITAITSDAQTNVDFYSGLLGLRLVKVTVNFDDPSSYHLYYGDELGRPGTILTFFAWPGAHGGRIGPPQVTTTAFSVQTSSIPFWKERLERAGLKVTSLPQRFSEEVIAFVDPDGMQLEIIGSANPPGQPWAKGPVSAEHAIRAFASPTISEEGYERTARLLKDVMGFKSIGEDQNRFRYRGADATGLAACIDLLCTPDARHGTLGAGIVHHIAFRTHADADQREWHEAIIRAGLNVSPVMDRTYFHSIYYREPGGVLFEIATDRPGFTSDQPANELGTRLMLPPWLEKHRVDIEHAVPPLRFPEKK